MPPKIDDSNKVLFLTTKGRRTAMPHTVEIWFALVGNKKTYLSHEGKHPDLIANLEKNPQVRLKVGAFEFDGTARIVSSGESLENGKKALYEKYYGPASSRQVIDDWFSLSTVVEVTPK